MIGKNWRVVPTGDGAVVIEHTYTGESTALLPGSTYSILLSPEGAALMAREINTVLNALALRGIS